MLSAAKHLSAHQERPFAALRVTNYYRSCLLKIIIEGVLERSFALKRIRTIEVGSHIGERVRTTGWLHSLRQMGGISFLIIRDGWGMIQAVAETEAELAPLLAGQVGLESVLAVEGLAVTMSQAPGGIELHNLQIEVITPVTEELPVSLNKRKITANLSTLLDHAAITNRHPARRAILRLSAGAMAGFRS